VPSLEFTKAAFAFPSRKPMKLPAWVELRPKDAIVAARKIVELRCRNEWFNCMATG
jgi:hypothetical protein